MKDNLGCPNSKDRNNVLDTKEVFKKWSMCLLLLAIMS